MLPPSVLAVHRGGLLGLDSGGFEDVVGDADFGEGLAGDAFAVGVGFADFDEFGFEGFEVVVGGLCAEEGEEVFAFLGEGESVDGGGVVVELLFDAAEFLLDGVFGDFAAALGFVGFEGFEVAADDAGLVAAFGDRCFVFGGHASGGVFVFVGSHGVFLSFRMAFLADKRVSGFCGCGKFGF